MPFHASNGSEIVLAASIDGDGEYQCTECQTRLTYVSTHTRGDSWVAAHFRHPKASVAGGDGGSDCVSGGESPTHIKMKSIAAAKIQQEFDVESLWIDSRKVSERLPDVLVELAKPVFPHGRYIAIECQYRNKGKDCDAVEETYLDNGITTLWIEREAFSLSVFDVDFTIGEWVSVWPHSVPEQEEWSGIRFDLHQLLVPPIPPHWRTEGLVLQSQETHTRCEWMRIRAEKILEVRNQFWWRKQQVKLPPDFIEEQQQFVWNTRPWSERFSQSPTNAYIRQVRSTASSPRMSVSVPLVTWMEKAESGHLHSQIHRAWEKGYSEYERQRRAKQAADPDPPQNPFNDVQCRECGTFWSHSKEYLECPSCGEEIDWKWNIRTGRISSTHLPPDVR